MPITSATRFLRLPFAFDVAALTADMAVCSGEEWTRHVNQRDYAGAWTGISLRSASGTAADLLSVAGIDGYRDTPLLEACSYFRTVVNSFQCDKETVRLLRLGPGSIIHEHRDRGASYADGFLRLHVPITTNEHTRFIVDDEVLPMRPGECWYANFGLPHSVHNEGTIDRVHLIIDALRNAWSDQLFEAAGYDFAAEARERQMHPDTRRMVVAELRSRGDDTSLRLAADLEAQATTGA